MLLAAGLSTVLLMLVLGAGAAKATCGDNWTGGAATSDWFTAGNWDNGVPTSASDVCITDGTSTVIINGLTENSNSAAAANTITVGSGNALELEAIDADAATVQLTNGGTISSGGQILMTGGCSSSCPGTASTTLNIEGGTLTNNGTITANAGTQTTPGGRIILGDLDNKGALKTDVTVSVPGSVSTVTNDTNGLITNDGGTSSLTMGHNTTFVEAGGTTNPNTANPANPAVVVDDSLNTTPFPTVSYTGAGASAIVARGTVDLNGNLSSGQNLVVDGNVAGCNNETVVSATSDFSNAGTITLTGTGCSGLHFPGATLTNTGTLNATATGLHITREIAGSLTNSGTLNALGDTTFDGSGATLTQTAGTTTIGPGKFLDLSGSNGTFLLQGGLLQAPGSSASHQSGVTGALNNSGGTLAPGSTTAPGDMTVSGHYTQGANGELTVVIDGTSAGTGYSQLPVGSGSTLGGTLNIVTHAGFTPTAGSLFTILGGSADTGRFAHVLGQFLSATLGYKLLYQANDLSLQAARRAKLTVTKFGSGSVTSSPAGIKCGTTCSAVFFEPAAVTLIEHPASGHTFKGWSGACTGKTTTCKVTMTKAKSVTATFS